MGESRRKRDKRPSYKATEKLAPLQIAKDKSYNEKQRLHCRSIIDKILADEASLSFSKPVDELWDRAVLTDYFEKIKRPMDLGTVKKRTLTSSKAYNSGESFDPNRFREEARLVFTNAIYYNGKSSDLGRLSSRFLQVIDSDLDKLPLDPNMSTNNVLDGEPGESKDVEDKSDSDNDDDDDDDDDNDNSNDGHDEENENNNSNNTDKLKIHKNDDSNNLSNISKKENENDHSINHKNENTKIKNELDDGDVDMEDKNNNDDENDHALDEERHKLETEINRLAKAKSRANASLAEIELEKNVPLSYEENSKLRDEVEALPWDISQKVVKILRRYVDDALKDVEERDPEFVTLEFSTVEPKLLREIEELIRPDPRVEKEKSTIMMAEREIEAAKRKLKRLYDGTGASAKKKRSKKSR